MKIESLKLRIDVSLMENIIAEKSFSFAIRIVNMCKYLRHDKNEYILSKQLLRARTSIGANVAESKNAQSRADFLSKLSIALKEASETCYWLRLLTATEYLSEKEFDSILSDCLEIEKTLSAIVKTVKQ